MGKTSEDTSIPENMKEKVEEYRRTLLGSDCGTG